MLECASLTEAVQVAAAHPVAAHPVAAHPVAAHPVAALGQIEVRAVWS